MNPDDPLYDAYVRERKNLKRLLALQCKVFMYSGIFVDPMTPIVLSRKHLELFLAKVEETLLEEK